MVDSLIKNDKMVYGPTFISGHERVTNCFYVIQ